MGKLKNLFFILTFRKLRDSLRKRAQNENLIQACQEGDFLGAQSAIQKGANVNVFIYSGQFNPGLGWTDIVYRSYVTPLILAATSAHDAKQKESYRKIISLLLHHPQIDLSRVAKDVEIEYVYQDTSESYKTLKTVLASENRDKGCCSGKSVFFSEQNYPISDEMVTYIRQELKIASQNSPVPSPEKVFVRA